MVFTFSGGTAGSVVNFGVSGGATFGTDYTVTGATSFTPTTGSVTLSGTGTASVNVTALTDAVSDSGETVVLTINGTTTSATGTINDTSSPTTLVNEKFDGAPIALTTGSGFALGSGVLQSSSATQNASSVLVAPSPAIPLPAAVRKITVQVTPTASSGTSVFSNGYIVFDYQSPTSYKVAGIEAKNQLWGDGADFRYDLHAIGFGRRFEY